MKSYRNTGGSQSMASFQGAVVRSGALNTASTLFKGGERASGRYRAGNAASSAVTASVQYRQQDLQALGARVYGAKPILAAQQPFQLASFGVPKPTPALPASDTVAAEPTEPTAMLQTAAATLPGDAVALPQSAMPMPVTDGPVAAPGSNSAATQALPAPESPSGLRAEATSAVAAPTLTTEAPSTADWRGSWKAAAATTPCGTCTGRACTMCSIRTGGPTASSGMPTGYSPKTLILLDPSDEIAAPTPSRGLPGAGLDPTGSLGNLPAALNSNAIVLENMEEGTPESEWMIGTGDPSIEGFAAQFTSNHGETVDFKIDTDSTDYRIEIYRLGYYGGAGARLMHTIEKDLSARVVQPIPYKNDETKLVDAGNWSVTASWDIPETAVSGVYFAKLTRFDGSGGENMIPFIVRDDDADSDITFQTSDTTWQAYNWWGGYNLYGGIEAGGRAGRASAVSYNRPIISRDGGFSSGPQNYVFGAEYAAIRFLEQNGYDVDYISGIDTAADAAQLLNGKVFLTVGHDEYWSGEQRANVEAARDAGINLSFWSGNDVYWETRWENSIDGTNTPYKTLVSYKERWDNANSDTQGTTSTWRDPVLGSGQPENALTGNIFTVDSYRLDAIDIPYDMSNLRFWSNTAVADLEPGEVYTLTKNLLGYEWNSDLDNGFRPAGLVPLSSTTVDVDSLLLDYGSAVGSGTASHSLTMYRAPSGALVFGAGTVYWSWGLDSHHDNETTPTDPNVQQAMINLFAEMGVQPATLMDSLVAASESQDELAPTTIITSPTAAGQLTAAQTVTITGTATDAGGGNVAVVEVSTNGGTSWHRASGTTNWSYSWTPIAGGSYTIRTRAVDDSINLETPGAGVTVNVDQGGTGHLFGPNDLPANPRNADPNPVNVGVRFSAATSGSIVGIRYYKGVGNAGEHIGTLWGPGDERLARATFKAETASGWQTVIFDSPVSITAGTTYVAGLSTRGGYAVTTNYFATPRTRGGLTSSSGVYSYGNPDVAPTSLSNTNYWVDVVYSGVPTPNDPPAPQNDNGFPVLRDRPITFQASTLLANDADPNNDPLTIIGAGAASGGSVVFNAAAATLTFTPNPGFVGDASFGYSVSDGRGGTGSAQVNMVVVPSLSTTSLFGAGTGPAIGSGNDQSEVNLGVKFVASAAGAITGIKYYKSATDTGTHTGTLWSSTGKQLATATFVNETASGWQTVLFSNPVQITAGTTYVASFQSNGGYATTQSYFTAPRTNGPLTAPAEGNGLFTYGADNLMPTSSFKGTNYWVDVLFESAIQVNRDPVATNDTGFTTPGNSPLAIAAGTLLANDSDPDGDTLTITGISGSSNGTAVFDAPTNTMTFTPATGFAGAASFSYTVADGEGGTASASVAVTVTPPVNRAPVAANDTGIVTERGQALQIAASTLLANDNDPDGDPLSITGVSGAVNGTVGFDALTDIVTFTPNAGYSGPASFNYAIADGRGGTASASVGVAVTEPVVGSNVFAANAAPATASVSETRSVELGMRFTAASSGLITGMRFYKGAQNTGTHTGTLWSSTGAVMGSVVFANETASGWQSANFSTPISITAGTSYIVSYRAPNGRYSASPGYFNTATTNGLLTAPRSVPGSLNGLYSYDNVNAPPDRSINATNYWVDVFYQQGTNTAPVAGNDTGFTTQLNAAMQITAASLLANDSDGNGDPLTITGVSGATNGTVAFDPQTNLVTFTPTANYTGPAGFSYAVADGRGGTATAQVALTVAPPATGISLFPQTSMPANVTVNDPAQVQLGMKFTSSVAGTVSGIKFYKGPQNTGPHKGTLWAANGDSMGTVTFQNETASGWQTASFATPIAIAANTTYVVSYHTNGNYSATPFGFTAPTASGPLSAPSSAASGGNGLFAYGGDTVFPNLSYNATNYHVDIVFNALAS